MKGRNLLLAVILLAMVATTLIPHAYSSTLTITVFTDKPYYLITETITIYGNLTYNGSPVQDWPVALEVKDPNNTTVVTRTPQTNTSGTYTVTFKLPSNSKTGTYTVYASAGYKGETATSNTTFESGPVINVNTHLGYMTIQAAINAPETLAGHTILVSSGTYPERPTINKHNLTLIGENRDTTIIDGGGGGNVVTVTVNNTHISGFTIQNSASVSIYSAIHLENSFFTTINNNKLINSKGNGIYLYFSSNNTITNNIITQCRYYGICFSNSPNNNLSDNAITFNIERGISLSTSGNNILRNNIFAGNMWDFNVGSNNLAGYIQDIDVSNTVNGKPIYYLINQNNLVVDNSIFPEIGYLALVNSTNITVKDLTLPTNNGQGILFAYTTNSTIQNVNSSNNNYGIMLDFSDDNNIICNTLTKNRSGVGVRYSSHNNITDNTLKNNEYQGINVFHESEGNHITNNTIKNHEGPGIQISSASNNITSNSIANNTWGILLEYSSSNNNVFGNNITNNSYGMKLRYAESNTIYHNNFINNTEQAMFEITPQYVNTWDDGYPSGGNYWSDYPGVDLYSGPSQNETGSDGIGDTPYIINDYNQDNYPLTSLWTPPNIAIVNIAPSKTIIGQGFTLHINVTVTNQGSCPEPFNVTAYANTIVIDTIANITLTSGNSTTLTFTWDTTSVAKGNYIITAKATQLPYETDLLDNTKIDGTVYIGTPGDINADGTVDVFDAVLLAGAAGSAPGSENWNPNADINSDNTVDVFDAVILAGHAGETWP